jgi:hypothetical protein
MPTPQLVRMPDIQPARADMVNLRLTLLMDGYLETADSGRKLSKLNQ